MNTCVTQASDGLLGSGIRGVSTRIYDLVTAHPNAIVGNAAVFTEEVDVTGEGLTECGAVVFCDQAALVEDHRHGERSIAESAIFAQGLKGGLVSTKQRQGIVILAVVAIRLKMTREELSASVMVRVPSTPTTYTSSGPPFALVKNSTSAEEETPQRMSNIKPNNPIQERVQQKSRLANVPRDSPRPHRCSLHRRSRFHL